MSSTVAASIGRHRLRLELAGLALLEPDDPQADVDDCRRQRLGQLRPDPLADQLGEEAGQEADDLRPADQPDAEPQRREDRRDELFDRRARSSPSAAPWTCR